MAGLLVGNGVTMPVVVVLLIWMSGVVTWLVDETAVGLAKWVYVSGLEPSSVIYTAFGSLSRDC